MGRRIVVTGRGGTGKTTFSALAARFLPEPKLLIDADSDESLAAFLGVDMHAEGIRTISDVLYDIQKGEVGADVETLPLPEKMESLVNTSCIYEGHGFDLLSMGVKWTRGCYCAPNNSLRTLIPRLAKGYATTLLDCPAGVEHLNRRLVDHVDDVFAIVDGSAKSVRNTETLRNLADAIGFTFGRLFVVGNYRFRADELDRLERIPRARFLGVVDHDPTVAQYDWEGRSMLDLPEDSPACASVRRLLEQAEAGLEPSRKA